MLPIRESRPNHTNYVVGSVFVVLQRRVNLIQQSVVTRKLQEHVAELC
jgi:hypothetical protein